MTSVIPEWFRRTKEGQRLEREAATEQEKTRAQLVADIREARRRAEVGTAELTPRIEQAERRHREALQAFREAEQALGNLRAQLMGVSAAAERTVSIAELALRESASEDLVSLKRMLLDADNLLRFGNRALGVGPFDVGSRQALHVITTVRAAIEEVDALMVSEVVDASTAIAAILQRIKDASVAELPDPTSHLFPRSAA